MTALYALEALRTPFWDRFMLLATNLGGEVMFMVAALIVFWCLDKKEGYYMMAVGFTGTILSQFLKLAFRIPRPWVRDPAFSIVEAARADAGGYSFPSGHTQNALTVFGCTGLWNKSALYRLLCASAIVLVGLSRMYLGVHTLLDVGVAAGLGLVLVLGLYPLFRDIDRHPTRMYRILGCMIGIGAAYLLYASLWTFPADIDRENLAENILSGGKLLGAVLGLLLGYFWEKKKVHFDTCAPLPGQILKVVLGIAAMLVLKEVPKAPLEALFHGNPAADVLRYLTLSAFAAGIWPMTFPWFSRLGRREQDLTKRRCDHESG